jgi:hypothetical protein
MTPSEMLSRSRVLWAFVAIEKHLQWYIASSEAIPLEQQERLLTVTQDIVRQLLKAQRAERRTALNPSLGDINWQSDVNDIRRRFGKRPVGAKRLVAELITAILEQKKAGSE